MIIKNVCLTSNQRVRLISEASCDWRNYAENSALHHRNKLL